ncbi:NUDIX hydrolase [Lactiplantibacillus paraplantarum]|uniref:NUDIX hydrolase n=1 Tax=Lactiplantibacillus paraplantarum TaxID=60520 RepID=UPI002072ABB5|nr:NUDIX hydrolase [Lactiplantibacillus paraplantarum]
MTSYHRAFGVYGIIGDQHALVVTKKFGGPYTNRYDLPGGSLEDGEALIDAIRREVQEETGLVPIELTQLGVTSFRYPWQFEQWRMNQHIAVFYRITQTKGRVAKQVANFEGQDSHGASRVPLSALTLTSASPLVLKAKSVLLSGQFDPTDQTYNDWTVLDRAVY